MVAPEAPLPRSTERRSRLDRFNRQAQRQLRRIEPYFLGGALATLAGAIALHRVGVLPPTLAAFALLGGSLALSLVERVRVRHRDEALLRAVRVTCVVGAAFLVPPVPSALPLGWLWLCGVAALYPSVLRPVWAFGAGAILIALGQLLLLGTGVEKAVLADVLRGLLLGGLTALSAAFGHTLDTTLRIQRGLRLREQRAGIVTGHSDAILAFTDRRFRLVHVNRGVEKRLGYTTAELGRRWGPALIHPEERRRFFRDRRQLLARHGQSALTRVRLRHANGHWLWFDVRMTNLMDHPAVRGYYLSAIDVTARIQAEQLLRNERSLLRTVVDYLPLSVYTKSRDGRFLMSNRANLLRLGKTSELEVVGRRSEDLHLAPQVATLDAEDLRLIEDGGAVISREVQATAADGRSHWYQSTKLPLKDAAGQVTGLVGIAHDITETKALQAFLVHQASHDVLTGLHNRRYFTDRLAEVLSARPAAGSVVLLFCDLDLFKSINDRYGHETGDQFLRALGTRLAELGRGPGRVLARFGGDEFVLLAELANPAHALPLAQSMLSAVRRPIGLDDLVLSGDASIGVATLRPDHVRPEDLIRDADTAMYQAKAQGRNRVAFFDGVLRERAIRHAGLIQALRGALERDELNLIYQPKISLRSGKVSGFEALMRWESPEYGTVSPQEFIPLAEESGLIVPFGTWALERACSQLRDWQIRFPHLEHLTIAVNVSMRQLLEQRFLADVVGIVENSRIYPAALELELTESAAMHNPDQSVALLRKLKDRGLRLALDDFGTGYSSLAYLRRLPVDVLKIDRAFVHGLESTPDDAEIVRLVLALTQTMGMESVAEGIESHANAAEIRRLGCDLGQGYYFSHGLPANEADMLLERNPEYFVA